MQLPKREHPKEKSILHPRNRHRERYDFKLLIHTCPELASFVLINKYDDESVDFFNPEAVKMLNKALLKHYYGIEYWDIPKTYLCPPIPGRVDYIHYMADLLSSSNSGKIPEGNQIKCLDIGVGANSVYPIIGNIEYGWSFVGSDIDTIAIESAQKIVEKNTFLSGQIELRKQSNPRTIFHGIINKTDVFDLSICNPPFHKSKEEAESGSLRKQSNLNHKKVFNSTLNFGGQNTELWCEGGEERFVSEMIYQSREFANSCFWFSSLVSKSSHLKSIYYALEKANVLEYKTIQMGQGNKISRIVVWTFLNKAQQKKWAEERF
ncbi:MAG: 23S rRNA (adenine(1618)-N(6))-methyltransferase RlmF [Bacteroidales bacterium]